MIIELKSKNIRHLFERSVELYGKLPSIAFVDEKPVLYRTLFNKIKELIAELIQHHIQPGERIAIVGDNSPNWVTAYLAVTSFGGVAVPILPNFPEEDIRHIIRDANCSAVFASEKHQHVLEGTGKSDVRLVISLENLSFEVTQKKLSAQMRDKVQSFLGKIQGTPNADEIYKALPYPEEENLAAIIYTSGTTGHSKGVMLSHRNIVSDVISGVEKFPIGTKDRFLSILPLSHTFEATGGMLCPLATGVSIYYMKGLPTPQKLLLSMDSAKPTGVLTVPLVMDKIYRKRVLPKLQGNILTANLLKVPVFRKILHKAAGRKLIQSLGGQLRFFMFGGAALNEDVEVFLRDAGISYSTGYGMTETSPILTINPFGKVRVGSCGQPIPDVELKIENQDPETGVGEIMVRGPMIMQGYYQNPEATREILNADGWLKTGDLGYIDEDGYVFIKGRSKNLLLAANGENIYPEIIEQHLIQNPYIQETVVYMESEKLKAKVYPDFDMINTRMDEMNVTNENKSEFIEKLLEEVRHEMNETFPSFSKLKELDVYPEPFEKTPTNKVKRYLYIPKPNAKKG